MLSKEMLLNLIELGWSFDYIKNAIKRGRGNKLHKAIKRGNNVKAYKLIEQGVNLNKQNINQETALHISLKYKNDYIANYLLNKGVQINLKDIDQNTPLHIAVSNSSYGRIESLIQKGANLNIKNDNGETALHIATKLRRNDVVKLLIDSGANYSIRDNNDQDVFDLANDNIEIKELIIHKENERIKNTIKQVKKISKDLVDKLSVSADVALLYTKIKQGFSVNLNNISTNKLDEVINLYNYIDTNIIVRKAKEITNKEILVKAKHIPILIRGIRGTTAIIPEKDNLEIKYNETGVELEIRKLLRKKGDMTRTKLKGTKDGNKNRCFTIINSGNIAPFANVGYGVLMDNINKVKLVFKKNVYSFEKKEEVILDNCTDLIYSDGKNISIQDKLNKLFKYNKSVHKVKKHNEIIMDVEEKDVKFIYLCNNNTRFSYEALKAIYFKRKYLEKTGRALPIIEYKLGQKEYLKPVKLEEAQIIELLRKEIKLNSIIYNTNRWYYYPHSADFLIAFKDEIKKIPTAREFVKEWINHNKKLVVDKDIYSIINAARVIGEFVGESDMQRYLQIEVSKELRSGKVLRFIKDKTMQKDKYLLVNLKRTKVNTTHRRKNIEIDFWFQILAQIYKIANTETINMLQNDIINTTSRISLLNERNNIKKSNIDLINHMNREKSKSLINIG